MQSIKSYTDLEQSKKLAEILPLESSDMYYRTNIKGIGIVSNIPTIGKRITTWDIPCWSLAALLDIIPSGQVNRVIDSNKWESSSWNDTDFEPMLSVGDYDNPVDACVIMIEKLHEMKVL